MKFLNTNQFLAELASLDGPPPVIVFGADICGRLLVRHLTAKGTPPTCFVDNNANKCGSDLEGIPVRPAKDLTNFPLDSVFLVASTYIQDISSQLLDLGFFRIYPIAEILAELPPGEVDNLPVLEGQIHGRGNFERDFPRYAVSNLCTSQRRYVDQDLVFLRSVDLIITEKCSLRCKDCANLMQYYERPVDIPTDELVSDIEDLVGVVDEINEIRVIGGEPLMNRRFAEVIARLLPQSKINKVVVYTNGTILPTDDQLEVLRSEKVFFFITSYGSLSRKKEDLIAKLTEHGINYNAQDAYGWTECGSIGPRNRAPEENEAIFRNCCAKNFISMTNGALYRCPFSANVVRLEGMPAHLSATDGFSVRGLGKLSGADREQARADLKRFLYQKPSLNACDFCAGRTYGDKEIEPGIQTRRPLEYVRFTAPAGT